MRTAPVFVTLAAAAALAGCGGKSPPATIDNKPEQAPWTVDRVLGTVEADAALVAFADVDALRANPLLDRVAEQLENLFAGQEAGACDDLMMSGKLVIVASRASTYEIAIWGVGGPTSPWVDCLKGRSAELGAEVTDNGDHLTMTAGNIVVSYLLLDPQTVLMFVSTQPMSRDELLARATRDGGGGIPELAALRGSPAPIWAAAHGSSRLFEALPVKFRGGTMTVAVTDRIAVDANVQLTLADAATNLAQTINQQGRMALSMGFLAALDARSAGEELIVHAELTEQSIDRMIAMFAAQKGEKVQESAPPPPATP